MELAGEPSSIGEDLFPWKKFWAVKNIAPKIKMFIWRALHNGLGVLQRIGKFVEGVDTVCRTCNTHEESTDHLLIHCNISQTVWFASPFGLRLQDNQHFTLHQLIGQWLNHQDSRYIFGLGASICWALWKARNSMVFERKQLNVQGILNIALYWFNLYYRFNEDGETEANNQQQVEINTHAPNWVTPPANVIKINVDAAVKDGHYAAAAITRNHEGICCGASTILGLSDKPVVAEADGFLLAVEPAIWLGFDDVIIERDCQVVTKVLRGKMYSPPWRIWRFIDSISARGRSINKVEFNFVPKRANNTAHSLAAYALSNNVQSKWISNQIPGNVVSSVGIVSPFFISLYQKKKKSSRSQFDDTVTRISSNYERL
ncbi:uncharacterized protein LOC113346221 [Papaver somniferum]|uniref:uncharacterized protein LOC113346221 n=1 Tax=Papaver somniferum TaxID=3469 RepID=UPI000E6FE56E|nr:uncharacterized protein LOC113346221 [Papaver somniferum]